MTRAEKFIIENHESLSAVELSHKLHISKAAVCAVLTEHGLTAKSEREPIKRASRRERTNICAGRPDSCFACPYPDCTCKDNQTDEEIRYRFAGMKSDSETAEYQRRKGRTKK